jgi:hypothetical protein
MHICKNVHMLFIFDLFSTIIELLVKRWAIIFSGVVLEVASTIPHAKMFRMPTTSVCKVLVYELEHQITTRQHYTSPFHIID